MNSYRTLMILPVESVIGLYIENYIDGIEKIQERALRFVYQDYETSYENLLIKAKMPTQHIRRIRTMALETFKI
jgi:ribosomal protein L6P/L9E